MSEVKDMEQEQLENIKREAAPYWFQAGELQYSILQAKKQLHKINIRLRKLNLKGEAILKALNAKAEAKRAKEVKETEAVLEAKVVPING